MRKVVDGRTRGEHGTTQAQAVALSEHGGELSYLVYGPLPEVVAECHVYLVGGIHELLNLLLALYAQATCSSCKLVQLGA